MSPIRHLPKPTHTRRLLTEEEQAASARKDRPSYRVLGVSILTQGVQLIVGKQVDIQLEVKDFESLKLVDVDDLRAAVTSAGFEAVLYPERQDVGKYSIGITAKQEGIHVVSAAVGSHGPSARLFAIKERVEP